jgi:hypothetical protein
LVKPQTPLFSCSDILKIDVHDVAAQWDSNLQHIAAFKLLSSSGEQKSAVPSSSVTLAALSDLRARYSRQHATKWGLLQELLRIDMDPSHPANSIVSPVIDILMNK